MVTLFHCRTVKPKVSRWYEVRAETPGEAANDFHSDNLEVLTNLSWEMPTANGGKYFVMFATIEVEGHGEVVSRVYKHGIFRKGGVKRPDYRTPDQKLKEMADALGWTHDPAELVAPGWDGDEGPLP